MMKNTDFAKFVYVNSKENADALIQKGFKFLKKHPNSDVWCLIIPPAFRDLCVFSEQVSFPCVRTNIMTF